MISFMDTTLRCPNAGDDCALDHRKEDGGGRTLTTDFPLPFARCPDASPQWCIRTSVLDTPYAKVVRRLIEDGFQTPFITATHRRPIGRETVGGANFQSRKTQRRENTHKTEGSRLPTFHNWLAAVFSMNFKNYSHPSTTFKNPSTPLQNPPTSSLFPPTAISPAFSVFNFSF